VLKLGERQVSALHDKGLVAGALSSDGPG
jgi:hypothetical protein